MHSEITLPPNAPKEYADRATLWNAVELSEKGQKSQLARMLKASLPNEWSYELAEEVVRDYVQRNFVDKGMCADWAIHDSENDKGQRNLHIHVLLTMRPFTENGEWGAKQKKIYDLDENGEKIPSVILSRLVDTFSSRILYPMLLLSGNHSIAAVLSWEEGLH